MKKKPFAISLSCRHCSSIGKRIIDEFKMQELLEHPIPYVELNWLGCAIATCRNFFHKLHALSRCPVCQRWSVKLVADYEMRKWHCLNPECGWEISLPRIP